MHTHVYTHVYTHVSRDVYAQDDADATRFLALEIPKNEDEDMRHVVVAIKDGMQVAEWSLPMHMSAHMSVQVDDLALAIQAAVKAHDGGTLPFLPPPKKAQRAVAIWDANRCVHTLQSVLNDHDHGGRYYTCNMSQARSWLDGVPEPLEAVSSAPSFFLADTAIDRRRTRRGFRLRFGAGGNTPFLDLVEDMYQSSFTVSYQPQTGQCSPHWSR